MLSGDIDLKAFSQAVQQNCHLVDARHAGDYTMCVYLMKMREYYRWEKGYGFDQPLPREGVGDWLKQREALWDQLDGGEFQPLPLAGRQFDPFDAEAINQHLEPMGLVYSAGLGLLSRPHFFLASLSRVERDDHFTILVSGREYARDLSAYPAMAQGSHIYIRGEAIRRMIFERLEEWRWNRPDNAMKNVLDCYDFETDLSSSLKRLAAQVAHLLVWHEKGEVRVGMEWEPAWGRLLLGIRRGRLELMLRAVRDLFADALEVLPALARPSCDDVLIHFYFANLTGMRRQLAPALQAAYGSWLVDGDRARFSTLGAQSEQHWRDLVSALMAMAQDGCTEQQLEQHLALAGF